MSYTQTLGRDRRRIVIIIAALVATVWSTACGDGVTTPPSTDPPRPTTITVSPATVQLTGVGATVQLTAEVRDQNGQAMADTSVTWASSSTAVAAVSAAGLVTAAANGTATITATAGGASGTAAVTVTIARWMLRGTVSHGWAEPQTNGFGHGASDRPGMSSAGESGLKLRVDGGLVRGRLQPLRARGLGTAAPAVTTPTGRVIAAVVEVVDGPDAGRRATADDGGRYVLQGLQEAEFTIRATAEGFASAGRILSLASDTVLDFAISYELPAPQSPSAFPDTDPAWLRALAADYPHVHQVANVRVFSDISPTFSREHAEHLRRVWDFFNTLYVRNRGPYLDVYYTTEPTVFLKVAPHCGASIAVDARSATACYLDDYPRWFIIPYEIPDFGTQLHEIGHDFVFGTWPLYASNWFIEGTAMYFEGGVFTDDGSLRVPEPAPYCPWVFDVRDREGDLMPLGELLGVDETSYSQSCMLFNYLERHEPGVLYGLIYRLNSDQISSNEQLVTALLALTGKSVSELEEAYVSYARRTIQIRPPRAN